MVYEWYNQYNIAVLQGVTNMFPEPIDGRRWDHRQIGPGSNVRNGGGGVFMLRKKWRNKS